MAAMQHVFILLFLCCVLAICTAAQEWYITRRNTKTQKECVKGQIYKMNCNTCHCGTGSTLICTKMACVEMPGLKKQKNLRKSGHVCRPGTFFKKGCLRCFCNNDNLMFCGPKDCKTVNKLPTTYEVIHFYSGHTPTDRHLLPPLPHQGAQCNPGSSYRIDCNTCLCLANGNLHCSQLLCPSHDDVHKEKAATMTGIACDSIGLIHPGPECIQCWCVDRVTVCQAKADCVPLRHTNTPLDLKESAGKCQPGLCTTMVRFGVLLIFAVTCLSIEGLLSQKKQESDSETLLEEVKDKCTPGKFYKRGCKKCFCDDKMRAICGGSGDCKLASKFPRSPSFIRSYSPAELRKLPTLDHQGASCRPGVFYRVDCNFCVCLNNKNLMCDDLLCPSYEDVNRINAKGLTGKPCTADNMNKECINCTCKNNLLECEDKRKCIPTDGRRDFQAESPLDLETKTEKRRCTKGMVYKRDCNRCYCQRDNTLRCTLMRCLKHTEVQRLQKLRVQLEKDGL